MAQITIYTSEEQKQQIDNVARMMRTNRSRLIRRAVDHYIENFEEFVDNSKEVPVES